MTSLHNARLIVEECHRTKTPVLVSSSGIDISFQTFITELTDTQVTLENAVQPRFIRRFTSGDRFFLQCKMVRITTSTISPRGNLMVFNIEEKSLMEETRSSERFLFSADEKVVAEITNPFHEGTTLKYPVIDMSAHGLSIRTSIATKPFQPGVLLPRIKVLIDGKPWAINLGEVVYNRKFMDQEQHLRVQVGIKFTEHLQRGVVKNGTFYRRINRLANPYSKLEKWQRMYVNRSLNMDRIKAIGFDMDHTLVMYNREEFESLAFRETLKKFIEAGYPDELADLTFKPNFLIRGLLVDMERGNLLKVDGHKYVKTAFHGTTKLDKETRHRLYNSESFKAQEFLSVDTFFALSEVQLFVEIVDFMDANPRKIKKSYREVYADLRRFIDLSHADGSIKNVVMADPGRFVRKDKYLATALMRLLDGGKTLFLLTNSGWDYTNCLMSYILDLEHEEFPTWRDYFDYTIVASGKPGFFTGSQPFLEVMTDSGLLRTHSGGLIPRRVYQSGNANLFQKLTKFRGDDILYVGDHIFGDIMQSKGKLNWRTLLVVEELEHELENLEKIKSIFNEIQAKINDREALDEELQITKSKLMSIKRHIQVAGRDGDTKKAHHLEKERDKYIDKIAGKNPVIEHLDKEIKELLTRKESSLHPMWGELMKVGLERSRFAYQVEAFACIYTSRVSNLRYYSPQKRFSSFHDILPHDP